MFNLFYTRFLSEKSARVVSCTSLAKARSELRKNSASFDAIILDNQLGDGDGIALLPLLHEQNIRTPVIMVSGNEDGAFLLSAFEQGIYDYIVKPVTLDLLWIKINNAVRQQALVELSEQQQSELEHWVHQEKQEQLLARHLFEHMFADFNQQHPAVRAWLKPHGIFSGDAILRCQGGDGSWYFMLADAMGHGLAPAISLMPVMQLFRSMAARTMPLDNIVYELNDLLVRVLPDDRFIAAVFVRVIPHRHEIQIWNAGMPAVILMNQNHQHAGISVSRNMALGILGSERINTRPAVYSMDDVYFFAMYSDGLTDTCTTTGNFIDEPALISYLTEQKGPADYVRHCFDDVAVQDDVSFCLVDVHQLASESPQESAVATKTGSLKTEITLTGSAIALADVPGRVTGFLEDHQLPLEFRKRVFTVVAELFSNCVEHGILAMDSRIKEAEDGFLQYELAKRERSNSLQDSDRFLLRMAWSEKDAVLTIEAEDRGAGFSAPAAAPDSGAEVHGRGLRLIESMTDEFTVFPPGNRFRVVMSHCLS